MGWTKHGVERIKRLSAKQQEQIVVFAEKWNRIARSTEPWDEDAVEQGIRRFCTAMDCRQPKRGFWYYTNPVKAYTAAAFDVGGYDWQTKVRTPGIHDKYNPNVFNLEVSEWKIRCRLNQSFEAPVLQMVEDFMHRNIARHLHPSWIERLSKRERGHRRIGYSQHDARWLAIVDYFATVHGNEHCKKLEGLMQAVASCGFVFLLPHKVWYSPRPTVAKFDDQGRLRCEDGPALKYVGWGFFYLHGVAVDRKYVETAADQLKIEDILKEPNAEVRGVALRKFGLERLLSTAKHRIVSEAGGNSLIEFKLRVGPSYNEYLRALRLKWQDKTGDKETMLPVPRLARQFGEDCPENINDCEQVRRWTLGWPKEALAVAET
jgi:hypothetical protein